jgi:hypothetical protein
MRERRFKLALGILTIAGLFSTWAIIHNASRANAIVSSGVMELFSDPLGPNSPIGDAKGILPGRVVWVYNPDATNESCTNSDHAHAYWLETNTNQEVVDEMFSEGIKAVTGEENDTAAWNAIFRYFNTNHNKGDVGYTTGETIFIKINAVTAYNGAEPNGDMPAHAAIEFDTSPQTIMAMLRQLVNVAGVPQEDIYIGDPMCDIWNTPATWVPAMALSSSNYSKFLRLV